MTNFWHCWSELHSGNDNIDSSYDFLVFGVLFKTLTSPNKWSSKNISFHLLKHTSSLHSVHNSLGKGTKYTLTSQKNQSKIKDPNVYFIRHHFRRSSCFTLSWWYIFLKPTWLTWKFTLNLDKNFAYTKNWSKGKCIRDKLEQRVVWAFLSLSSLPLEGCRLILRDGGLHITSGLSFMRCLQTSA